MRIIGSALLTLGLIVAVAAPMLLAANSTPNQDRVWANFGQFVKFSDRLLPPGDYLFVHDDDKKAAGEPCLYVYRESNTDEPLVAIHCVRGVRTEIERDKIAWRRITPSMSMRNIEYVQFAGDSFAHYIN
jgi:hypothetical protein